MSQFESARFIEAYFEPFAIEAKIGGGSDTVVVVCTKRENTPRGTKRVLKIWPALASEEYARNAAWKARNAEVHMLGQVNEAVGHDLILCPQSSFDQLGAIDAKGQIHGDRTAEANVSDCIFYCIEYLYASAGSLEAASIPRDGQAMDGVLDQLLGMAQALFAFHNAFKPAVDSQPHGDVKRHNFLLFLANDGRWTIKIADPQTWEGFGGTWPYNSPERCAGAFQSVVADVYALGVTFYQHLTGSYPVSLDGKTLVGCDMDAALRAHWKAAHLNAQRPFSWCGHDWVHSGLCSLVERMIAIDPDDRPSMQQIILELREMRAESRGTNRKRRLPAGFLEIKPSNAHFVPNQFGEFRTSSWFRQKALGQAKYLVKVERKGANDENVAQMWQLAVEAFGRGGSLFQVSGKYDYVISVTSPSADLVGQFSMKLRTMTYSKAVKVMGTEEIRLANKEKSRPLSRNEISPHLRDLWRLMNESLGEVDRQSLVHRLVKANVVIGRAPKAIGAKHVVAFSQIWLDGNKNEQEMQLESLLKAIRSRALFRSWDVVAYRNVDRHLFGDRTWTHDLVLEFIAPSYDSVRHMNDLIFEVLGQQPNTMIESKKWHVRDFALEIGNSPAEVLPDDPDPVV
ncbi:MAG: hypothetical protein M3552_20940 [Planctomycetota bacterium]|nr:hypothetical protein [Planctomycetaceae bacterium]MDQ3333082.1 hypothetical protein [Planctomycetota bacterium]